jgi:hypothetical protein
VAYIGTQPLAGQYRKLDDISGGFNGSTTSFTTSVGGTNVTAGSSQQLLVSLGGVIQQPTTDYTVNTSTIIFTTAPASGLSFFAILMGDALNTSVPADGSITSAKLAGSLSVGLAAGSASTPSLFFSGDANTGIYSPGADQVALTTAGTARLYVSSAGLVGIGTTSPTSALTVNGSISTPERQNAVLGVNVATSDGNGGNLTVKAGGGKGVGATSGALYLGFGRGASTASNGFMAFGQAQSTDVQGLDMEYARIDSSGRLLIGTSTSPSAGNGSYSNLVVGGQPGASTSYGNIAIVRNQAASALVTNSGIGGVSFCDNTGGTFADILCQADATPGSNDFPGRLVFSVTSDGSASPVERGKLINSGYWKFSNSGDYNDSQGGSASHYFQHNASGSGTFIVTAWNNSFNNFVQQNSCLRAANSAYSFFAGVSGNGSSSFADNEFNLRGDGTGLCDGSWTGGGADYAEYFEWADNNPDAEDRRGISVVLDGDKIREAVAGEDPIGVISGNPSVVGDAAWNKWSGKYLRDDFGTYIQEDYEVEDEDGNTVVQQRRKLNPAYDPDVEYISREQRPEWDCVGLMGKLRIRKGQVTGSRWIKMRDISDSVEEWLVR